MNKIFATLFIFFIGYQTLSADEVCYCNTTCHHHAYRYQTIGTGPVVFIPNVGVGYRTHIGHHGWDASLNFGTIGYGNQLQASLLYHFIPSPQTRQHWYWGLGASGSALFGFGDLKGFTGLASGMFALGKEFCCEDGNTHFIETKISIPNWVPGRHSIPLYFPMMIIQYGSSF